MSGLPSGSAAHHTLLSRRRIDRVQTQPSIAAADTSRERERVRRAGAPRPPEEGGRGLGAEEGCGEEEDGGVEHLRGLEWVEGRSERRRNEGGGKMSGRDGRVLNRADGKSEGRAAAECRVYEMLRISQSFCMSQIPSCCTPGGQRGDDKRS